MDTAAPGWDTMGTPVGDAHRRLWSPVATVILGTPWGHCGLGLAEQGTFPSVSRHFPTFLGKQRSRRMSR